MRFLLARMTALAALLLCAATLSSQAAFHPHRIYKIRKKASLNQGWKFYRNNPAGNPYEPGYDDAAWETVNVPHSALYVPPTPAGERTTLPGSAQWTGISWYRNSFTVPNGAPAQKIFLDCEGAMQSAEIWINGTRVGTHDASGYTGFCFDISSLVDRAATNVIVMKLDCAYKWEIPPGNVPMSGMGEYPDFYIYSGLYRDVWLVFTGNIYIPWYGQKVSSLEVSQSSARVRVRTVVRNDSSSAISATIRHVIVNADDTPVAELARTATIPVSSSFTFDCMTDPIASPRLWSLETPNLYRIFTHVTVGNRIVDDYVERFGIRKIDWKNQGGVFLNDQRCVLRGVNMHQQFAWVGNALPNSRYAEEVRLVKEMGANAIRCAHYPREPAFYDACDELGVLCEPELPSWGGSITSYPQDFWDRMDSCAREMVATGYNHPSIILWGLFNEPAGDFPTQFTHLHTRIKSMDSTRFTSNINNKNCQANGVTDVFGQNYSFQPSLSNQKMYNAEYHEGWMISCYRGDTVSRTTTEECFVSVCYLRSEDQYATERYDERWVRDILNNTGDTKPLAGGHMWCLVDYWSPCNVGNHPMGVLDHYRIPKKVYYTFRTNWAGKSNDYPVVGLTASTVRLEADVTALVADGTDLSRVIASIRDASGTCVWSSDNVSFEVAGPCTVFDDISNPVPIIAGKIGIIVKSTNTPGTITVTARSGSLTQATLSLTSIAPDTSSLPFIMPPTGVDHAPQGSGWRKNLSIAHTNRSLVIAMPIGRSSGAAVSLLTVQGKTIACPVAKNTTSVVIDTRAVPGGVYHVLISMNGSTMVKRILVL